MIGLGSFQTEEGQIDKEAGLKLLAQDAGTGTDRNVVTEKEWLWAGEMTLHRDNSCPSRSPTSPAFTAPLRVLSSLYPVPPDFYLQKGQWSLQQSTRFARPKRTARATNRKPTRPTHRASFSLARHGFSRSLEPRIAHAPLDPSSEITNVQLSSEASQAEQVRYNCKAVPPSTF